MDLENFDCYSDYRIDVLTGVTSRQPSPSFQIKFEFSYRPILSDQEDAEQPLMNTIVCINLEQFITYKAYGIIEEKIQEWSVSDEATEDLIGSAMIHAREVIASMPASHNHVYIYVHITTCYSQNDIGDYMFEDEDVGMIPADDSSIASLEMRKMVSGNCCSVCLEDFSQGCEAVSMPCRHFFHQDCIIKWLKISHYCPNCRFQMPTI